VTTLSVPSARFRPLILALCWIAGQTIADTLSIIELRHRSAAEIQPLIQPLLRADEALSGTGYRLFLRTTDARRREIEQLVAKLDVALRQFTITVQTGVRRSEHRARDSVSGEVGVGRARVVIPDDEGGAEPGLRYRGERRTSIVDATSTQVVRVQEGQHAFIRVGQSVPSVERVLVPTGRHAAVLARGARSEDFTSGFDVLPRAHGETVELEITPRLSNTRDAEGTYRIQELRTTVTAHLGEWIDIGLVLGETSDANRAILQSAQTQGSERSTIALKVE
jgi:hypothetical protein